MRGGEEKGTGYFPADVGTSEPGITIITNLGIGCLRACSQVGKNIQSNGAAIVLRKQFQRVTPNVFIRKSSSPFAWIPVESMRE